MKVLDHRGVVKYFNPEGVLLMEFDSVEQVRGKSWPQLWPVEMQDTVEESLRQARLSGASSFSAPCPTAKGTKKWWNVTVATMPGSDGDFIAISRDITATREVDRQRDADHERLSSIIRSTSDVLWDIDLVTDQVWWGDGMTSTFGYAPDRIEETPAWFQKHIHPDDRLGVIEGMRQAVASSAPIWEDDFRYCKADGSYVDVYNRGAIIRDMDGVPRRFVGVMQDVTARNAVGEAHKALAGEMAHRVNNVLAVVSGLFQQTAGRSASVGDLTASFADRLGAMATANMAILRTAGSGVSLQSLVDVQLAPFLETGRLHAEGEEVVVPEQLAQPLALALNELATNAVKYGALSNDDGQIDLGWTKTQADGRPTLILSWAERGGPVVSQPTRNGLGSRLIDRGIRQARVERSFAPEGFACSIAIPLEL